MAICRLIASFRPSAWRCEGWLLLLGLAACGIADQRTASQPTLIPRANLKPSVAATADIPGRAGPTTGPAATSAPNVAMQPVSTPEVRIIHGATPEATTAAATTWQAYHSTRGSYTIEYPAGWTVAEQSSADGAMATTFTAANGGVAIVVAVHPTDPAQQAPLGFVAQFSNGGTLGQEVLHAECSQGSAASRS